MNESLMITTVETVRDGLRTTTGCWDEADHKTLDLDEATTVVTVDEAYLDTHLPIVSQRLTRAGIRLGHFLNGAVGGE